MCVHEQVVVEDHTSSGSRQRVCQRSLRQDSSRSNRRGEEVRRERGGEGKRYMYILSFSQDTSGSPRGAKPHPLPWIGPSSQQDAITCSRSNYITWRSCDHSSLLPSQAILNEMVTDEEYRMLMSRIGELKRGRHLASDPDDNSPGSIHWIDGIYMHT